MVDPKEQKEQEVTYIGKCNFRGNERVFGIKKKDRRQHMYVIGKTGVGKSALLKNMALQDIRAGRGIGIVDPHGEFVEEVLEQIPSNRINDVVYFNPVDADYPIGFNVLEVPDVKYKHLVVSDLLGIFTKIWANVWSARMEYILQNCILALIDTPGTTLLGIPRILVDKEYRDAIVANVTDPVVRSFWTQEYETWRDQFRNEAIVPIQNKVGQFLNTSFVRNIVGQPTSSLNIPDIMNTGKILLVNVSKGKIGEDNSALLGAMIITKIQLAAMERVRIAEEDRLDFYLYVDEFQNFATDSFAAILSEARKYRLNLFIAHQYVGQLVTDVSTKVRDAVFGNVGTMISFRVGATDAEFLEKEFTPEFLMADLINLPNYHIYLKLMVDGMTSRPFSSATLPPLKYDVEPNIRERIIDASRARYSRAREGVESVITEWSSPGGGAQKSTAQGAFRGDGQIRSSGNSSNAARSTNSGAEMFDAQCFNCGKMTQVPFKPDGKRPVYCMPCLKQIEEGKLIPLPDRMPSVAKARYGSTLGDLGIEFESSRPMPTQMPNREAPLMRANNSISESRPQIQQERNIPAHRSGNQREQRSGVGMAPSLRQDLRPRSPHPDSFSRPPYQDTFSRRPLKEEQRPVHSSGKEHIPDRDRGRVSGPAHVGEKRQEKIDDVAHGGFRSRPVVRTPEKSPKISLQSLKPSEKEALAPAIALKEEINEKSKSDVGRKEANTSDLRDMLAQVLNETTKVPMPPLPVPPPPPTNNGAENNIDDEKESIPHKPPSSGHVLKPGDTIRF